MDTKTPFVSDEQKPFNGHTKGNATAIPFDERWMVSTPEQIVLITVGGNDEENARFAAHCWNTYYQREAELQALRDRMRLSQWLFTNLEDVILSFRGKQFPDGIGEVAFKEKSAHEFDVMYEPEGRFDLIYVRYNTFKRQFISASGYGVTLAISNNP